MEDSGKSAADVPGETDRLTKAIAEMELLLAYATQAGRAIPQDRIDVLIDAKRQCAEGAVDGAVEKRFWHEFQQLGLALQPITVASLQASSDEFGVPRHRGFIKRRKEQVSDARVAVRRYQTWSVLALVSLLLVQVYTIFGSNVVWDLERLDRQIDEQTLRLEDLSAQLPRLDPNSDQYTSHLATMRTIDIQIEDMNTRLLAKQRLLVIWFPVELTPQEERSGLDQTKLNVGQVILESLSKYFLPLLYGLLGACVYVLRGLSNEVRCLTYTEASDIRFRLRIYLGALAGLAIGWFAPDQDTAISAQSLAPSALAFLAGYSVELLFSVMDTLIDAFSRSKPERITRENQVQTGVQ